MSACVRALRRYDQSLVWCLPTDIDSQFGRAVNLPAFLPVAIVNEVSGKCPVNSDALKITSTSSFAFPAEREGT